MGLIDRNKIFNYTKSRRKFNVRLEELNAANNCLAYLQFFENVMRARADTAMRLKLTEIGWFKDEKEILAPVI